MRCWMMRSWMMRCWMMAMMINHMMMLNNWSNMVAMTMHLMMFLVNSMMSSMISHTVTHMMSGGRDGHMVSAAGDGGGASMVMGRGFAKRGEQRQPSMWGNIMRRREDMSRVEP